MPEFTTGEEQELYLAVKRFLLDNYEPTHEVPLAVKLTTDEIFQRLQQHIPGAHYCRQDVALWMVEGGYTTFTIGELRTMWLLKKRDAPAEGA